MDESNQAQGQAPDSSAAPQRAEDLENSAVVGNGLFSTAETSVETENLPPELGGSALEQPAPVLPQGNSSRISSAFGGGAASRSRTSGANPNFANNPNFTSSTIDSDINLAPTQPKKKSKLPIIIIIAILILGGAGGAFWFLTNNAKGNGEKTIAELTAEMKTMRNKFINYYLFGEDSDAGLTVGYDEMKSYRIETAVSERDIEFIEQAKTMFDEYYSSYDSIITRRIKTDFPTEDEAEQAEQISEYRYLYENTALETFAVNFDFIYRYTHADELDSEKLLQTFKEADEDLELMHAIIESNYADLANAEHEDTKSYIDGVMLQQEAFVDQWYIYYRAGCLTESGVYDSSCSADLSSYDFSRIERADEADLSFYSIPGQCIRDSLELIWDIVDEQE